MQWQVVQSLCLKKQERPHGLNILNDSNATLYRPPANEIIHHLKEQAQHLQILKAWHFKSIYSNMLRYKLDVNRAHTKFPEAHLNRHLFPSMQ